MYDKKVFKDMKVAKSGTKLDGEITDIKEGVLSDFVKNIQAWENKTGNEACINIEMTLSNSSKITKIVMLPQGNEVHPKSAMGLWKKQFGDYPFINQEIFALADGEGRFSVPKL